MSLTLKPNEQFRGAKGPVVLVVLDGVGIGSGDESDAVKIAATPTLDRLWAPGARCALRASGHAVGLPSEGDMGNSEVGHNALGCGRVFDQGAKLVANAIADGSIFRGATWQRVVARCVENSSALHLMGLLSDGNIHSHIDHIVALVRNAASSGIGRVRIHVLTDGRDVGSQSALDYVDRLEAVLAEVSAGGCDAAIASGGGRMLITMDRYGADWPMVERGWNTHVHGEAPRFASARAAIERARIEDPERSDQYMPAFVVERDGVPIGAMHDGDCVININFRGDRALEISEAFGTDVSASFEHFDRGRVPQVFYAGMMEYDGDLHVPEHFLVEPPVIERTMGEYLVHNGVTQLAIAETQKFGHVTYFWNGNRSGMFDESRETYIEIPSDRVCFDERPWMKAAEITDRLIAELLSGKHRFVRVNYANGDMVGHTGSFQATVIAVESIDLQLARLARAIKKLDGILLVTADHGNADEMFQHGKDGHVLRAQRSGIPISKTSHTLNPVPLMIYDPNRGDRYQIDPARAEGAGIAGIANVTATCLQLLGFEPPADLTAPLLRFG